MKMSLRSIAPGNRSKWIVLALSYLLMVLYGFALQSLPPLSVEILREFPLTHMQMAALMGAYTLPGLVMPLATAAMATRIRRKSLALGALAAVAAGTFLFAIAPSYPFLLAGRLLSGLGGIVLLSLAPVFVNNAFDRSSIGKVIGFFNTGVTLGCVSAMSLFGLLGRSSGWRLPMIFLGGFILAAAILFSFFFSETADERSDGTEAPSRGGVIAVIVPMALVNVFLNAGSVPFSTFGPEYLRTCGFTPAAAALFLSGMMLFSTFLGPLAGFLVDRIRMYRPIIMVSGVTLCGAFLLMLVPGIPLVTGAALLSAGAAVIPVTMFPLLNEVLEPRMVGMGLSILITASNIGTNFGLGLFGTVVDRSGFPAGLILLSVLGLLIVPAVLRIPKPGTPAETETAPEWAAG
jgi:predicted MFS family arabinose efflux permease